MSTWELASRQEKRGIILIYTSLPMTFNLDFNYKQFLWGWIWNGASDLNHFPKRLIWFFTETKNSCYSLLLCVAFFMLNSCLQHFFALIKSQTCSNATIELLIVDFCKLHSHKIDSKWAKTYLLYCMLQNMQLRRDLYSWIHPPNPTEFPTKRFMACFQTRLSDFVKSYVKRQMKLKPKNSVSLFP